MEKKICGKCNEEKYVCEFGVHKSTKDKLRKTCKECRKIECKNYREQNPEVRKLTLKKWHSKNSEYNRNYYLNNIESINKKNKEWYVKNKEKHREINRIWKEKNIEKVREYHNNLIKYHRKSDPTKRLIYNTRNRIISVLKNKKQNKTFDIVGCTPQYLKEFLEKKFIEGMSWDNYGLYGWHIDHIIPLSSAKTEEEIYKLCHYTNLQPLWAEDNLKKSNKIITNFPFSDVSHNDETSRVQQESIIIDHP